jgi:hypothetical protein
MTDKTPTLVEELQSLFNGGAVRDYGAAPVIEAATRHEQAWQVTLTAERERADRAEQERDDALRLMATARDENRWLEAYGRVEAENARLRAALEAFIDAVEFYDCRRDDKPQGYTSLWGAIVQARAALTSTAPTGETR